MSMKLMRSISFGRKCLNQEQQSAAGSRIVDRKPQTEGLRQKEAELGKLAVEENKDEFFKQIIPFLNPLRAYIHRRLRVSYLNLEIRTPIQTTGDILDRVVLNAYENFDKKPTDLTLEQWLYRLANEILDDYVAKRRSRDPRRKSFETLEQKERSTLEEIPFTADADAEPWFPEELDDSEYQPREFTPPAYEHNPEEELENKEELQEILQALSRVPDRDRMVFDLYAIEGFSKEEVGKILSIPPENVPRIANEVIEQVRHEISTEPDQRKAS
jgi:RNA polymerase sigma factor (sigma-70 family)